jgi:hypothetical protein
MRLNSFRAQRRGARHPHAVAKARLAALAPAELGLCHGGDAQLPRSLSFVCGFVVTHNRLFGDGPVGALLPSAQAAEPLLPQGTTRAPCPLGNAP